MQLIFRTFMFMQRILWKVCGRSIVPQQPFIHSPIHSFVHSFIPSFHPRWSRSLAQGGGGGHFMKCFGSVFHWQICSQPIRCKDFSSLQQLSVTDKFHETLPRPGWNQTMSLPHMDKERMSVFNNYSSTHSFIRSLIPSLYLRWSPSSAQARVSSWPWSCLLWTRGENSLGSQQPFIHSLFILKFFYTSLHL